MDTKVLINSFTDFAKQKNVDRPTMIRILQDVFRAMIKKKFEHDENFDIVINADKGDLEIMRFREIVDDNSEDIWDFDKIKLSDAKNIEKDFEVGDEVAEEIKIEDFGRRAVILAKQEISLSPSYSFKQSQAPITISPEDLINGVVNITPETNIFDFKDAPDGYFLLDFSWRLKLNDFSASINVNNVLNTSYRNYLNSMRYFADEIGRNFIINFSYTFKKKN